MFFSQLKQQAYLMPVARFVKMAKFTSVIYKTQIIDG